MKNIAERTNGVVADGFDCWPRDDPINDVKNWYRQKEFRLDRHNFVVEDEAVFACNLEGWNKKATDLWTAHSQED